MVSNGTPPFRFGLFANILSLRTKQYYQFIQKEWIEGDDGQPPPPPERKWVRNKARGGAIRVSGMLILDSVIGMEAYVYQRHLVYA